MPVAASDERRRARAIVFGALITLFVLYFVKFTFPRHTVRSVMNGSGSTLSSVVDSALPGEKGGNALAGLATTTSAAPQGTATSDSITPTSGTIMDRVAVIIEDRPQTNLIPLLLHFSSVLGPSWPVIIYTSQENVASFSSSAALRRHLKTGIISIRVLPLTVLFTNSDSVSRFLTQPWLWEDVAPAEHVLLFQSDSMLCANAVRSVEDFFEYDFVGAPFAAHLGEGMNGGLSLRKRKTLLRILDEWDWETHKGSRFEDRWYYDRMIDIIEREEVDGIEPSIKLPTMEVSRTFSVETIDFPHPLGVHQVNRWLSEDQHRISLDEWCPEYKLCSGDYIHDG